MRHFDLKGKNTPSEKYWWLNEESSVVLDRGYLLKGETVQDAVKRITEASANRLGMPELTPQFAELVERGWMSLSSPIWANMGTKRGLPISCFNVHVPDSMEGIATKLAEVIMQTKLGGGTSGYFGELRERGAEILNNGKSNGAPAFMQMFDKAMEVVSQGQTRRGSFAAYLDIEHKDIDEFLNIRSIGDPIQNLLYGVCIPDNWMKSMIDGDSSKRKTWAKVLESRQQKGVPYLFFTDNVNKNKPEIYKALNSKIKSSNLCTEVLLPSTEDESFICCLSSMNVALFDEWKDTEAVQLATLFLDGVLQEFIDKVKESETPFMNFTYNFAKRHRAIGLGVLGYHSYLQKNMIPFDSWEAKRINVEIFKHISEESKKASKELGDLIGYADIFYEVEGVERFRNTTTMAIAPTTTSSSILGQVSAGIEPFSSNYYKVGLSKGSFMRKNPELEKLLESLGKNNKEVWDLIKKDKGSVQKLDFLTKEQKDVFKTFKEISQVEILNQAVSRQRYIDQGQSVNTNIPPEMPVKEVNKMIIDFWESGGTTLYYQRSQSVAKELLSELSNCTSCES